LVACRCRTSVERRLSADDGRVGDVFDGRRGDVRCRRRNGVDGGGRRALREMLRRRRDDAIPRPCGPRHGPQMWGARDRGKIPRSTRRKACGGGVPSGILPIFGRVGDGGSAFGRPPTRGGTSWPDVSGTVGKVRNRPIRRRRRRRRAISGARAARETRTATNTNSTRPRGARGSAGGAFNHVRARASYITHCLAVAHAIFARHAVRRERFSRDILSYF
jgi:hypothetical protein